VLNKQQKTGIPTLRERQNVASGATSIAPVGGVVASAERTGLRSVRRARPHDDRRPVGLAAAFHIQKFTADIDDPRGRRVPTCKPLSKCDVSEFLQPKNSSPRSAPAGRYILINEILALSAAARLH